MSKKKEKWTEYAMLLTGAIGSVFEEESEFHISQEELGEDNNLTEFFHALANVVPTYLYNELTGEKDETVDFNHKANKLCFQFKTNK